MQRSTHRFLVPNMDTFNILIPLALLTLLGLALELGFRLGRRAKAEAVDSGGAAQIGAVQGATLGLLGLLLAFSFGAAGSRFLERQDLIVTEANSIGTAFLRADLLNPPHRGNLQSALRDYTTHRVELSARLHRGMEEADHAQIQRFHQQIWDAARDGVLDRPDCMLAVLAPVNDVIDLHSTRLAAGQKHLPLPVLDVLIGCSALAIALIGFGSGLSGRRRFVVTESLSLLIAAALWITIDLDHPRAGLLRLNDAPLKALDFNPPSPPP